MTAKWMWLLAVFVPVLTFIGKSLCVCSAPRFLQVPALLILFIVDITAFGLIYAAIGCIKGLPSMLRMQATEESRRGRNMFISSLTFMVLWFNANELAAQLRHKAFVNASVAGGRIVTALEQFREEKKTYPQVLHELVPKYLDHIPHTGMIAYPEFDYQQSKKAENARTGGYEIQIWCPSGGMNFDRFIYWPTETYPESIEMNLVRRFGGWAYIHD